MSKRANQGINKGMLFTEESDQLSLFSGETELKIPPSVGELSWFFNKRPAWPVGLRKYVFERDNGICYLTGSKLDIHNCHLDHVVSAEKLFVVFCMNPETPFLNKPQLIEGWLELYLDPSNIRITEPKANMSKGSKSYPDKVLDLPDVEELRVRFVQRAINQNRDYAKFFS